MTRENAKKLQSTMAKEAVTLLMLGGAEADTAEHEEPSASLGKPGACRGRDGPANRTDRARAAVRPNGSGKYAAG